MKQKIKNSPYMRDTRSKAIINTDSFTAFKNKRDEVDRIDRLESEVTEIKQMLHMIMAKL